jgi:eukaryotic-like serine/threonine-protein kinase
MKNASGARIGEYLLDREVTARSTEVAYRATHRVLPRCARLAILNPAFIGVRLAEVQLMREAYILEALHHTGVPRAFECGMFERRSWIATEFIDDGMSIKQAAAERPLPISDALEVIRDASAILVHAHHRGVIHRNITPRAIVRTPARGSPLCITEWGNASINDNVIPHVVDPDARFYRAPELVSDGFADGRSDVFALGAVVFEAATRALPEPLRKIPGMPVAFHALLEAMLARFPAERPTAAMVHAEATRLAEVYADGGGSIEEVEVELIDISRGSSSMSGIGWLPPLPMDSLQAQALGTLRRRREP